MVWHKRLDMKKDIFEYNVQTDYICAILYGDYTALDNHEIEALEVFLDENAALAKSQTGYISHHWVVNNDDEYIEGICSICDLFARIVKITMVVLYD